LQQSNRYETLMNTLKQEIQREQAERAQEGGDMTHELHDAVQREQTALLALEERTTQLEQYKRQVTELTTQKVLVEEHNNQLTLSLKTAAEREQLADARLDDVMKQQAHQLAQRQSREAELERTVAELGAALTAAQPSHAKTTTITSGEEATAQLNWKEQYEEAADELQTVKTKLQLSDQRCEALQLELQSIQLERANEVSLAQERERQYAAHVENLTGKQHRLEASLRTLQEHAPVEDDTLRNTHRETDELKRQVVSLSEQLVKQHGIVEASKSEMLALKGRLQTASARADAAEVQLAEALSSPMNMHNNYHDIENGTTPSKAIRRRIKGGTRGLGGRVVPSHMMRPVRTVLGLQGAAKGSVMEQIGLTVDGIDTLMLESGALMKQEPLARIALAAYLFILHAWCFGLVFFHAVQSEHGDLGALTKPHGPLHPLTGV
jgi:hypothetical protein